MKVEPSSRIHLLGSFLELLLECSEAQLVALPKIFLVSLLLVVLNLP